MDDPRKWLELRVTADTESVEPVAEVFRQFGYNSGVIIQEPYVQDPDGDNLEIDPTRPVEVSTYLPVDDDLFELLRRVEEALWHLRQIGTVGELRTCEESDQDWANAWKEHFHVTRIGRQFVIQPSWRPYEPGPEDVVIQLDPGLAFGTGLHPTTSLCLRWLEELPVAGRRVLDAGAGSGILSIGVAKRGAEHVDAVEIDTMAIDALRHNVELNGLSDHIHVWQGDVTATLPIRGPYDLILANMISRILIASAENLAQVAQPGGLLVLSGVIDQHEADVTARFAQMGFTIEGRKAASDWVSLVAVKQA